MSDLRTQTERNRKADCNALGIPYVIQTDVIENARKQLAAQRKQRAFIPLGQVALNAVFRAHAGSESA